MEARFLLLSDVAAELNVSDSQVYHMVRSGELPAIKIGGRGQWRVERARLEEYIQQKYAETATWVQHNPLGEREGTVEARFLLLSDVAAELNVSDSQVYHMVRSGELPAIKIGGRGQWRVERARLEEYIQQKYAETASWVQQNPLVERDGDQPA